MGHTNSNSKSGSCSSFTSRPFERISSSARFSATCDNGHIFIAQEPTKISREQPRLIELRCSPELRYRLGVVVTPVLRGLVGTSLVAFSAAANSAENTSNSTPLSLLHYTLAPAKQIRLRFAVKLETIYALRTANSRHSLSSSPDVGIRLTCSKSAAWTIRARYMPVVISSPCLSAQTSIWVSLALSLIPHIREQ